MEMPSEQSGSWRDRVPPIMVDHPLPSPPPHHHRHHMYARTYVFPVCLLSDAVRMLGVVSRPGRSITRYHPPTSRPSERSCTALSRARGGWWPTEWAL